MANHKRKRPKSQRAGCIHCKPHKAECNKDSWQHQTRQEQLARISEEEFRVEATQQDE